MRYTLRINGRLSGLNEYIASCRMNRYKGANLKEKNEAIILAAIHEQLRRVKIDKPVYMHYRWYEKDRRRDLDNISSFGRKVIQDALVKSRVLKNDGWREIVGFRDDFFIDGKHPRIEVEIEVIE